MSWRKNLCPVKDLGDCLILKGQNDEKNISHRLEKYDRRKYAAKKKKIYNNLGFGEKFLVLAKRIEKNQHLGNFINKLL